MFPQIYAKFSEMMSIGHVSLFEGKVEKRQDKLQFIIQRVLSPEELPSRDEQAKLFIKIDKRSVEQHQLLEVKKILKSFHGETPVFLYYEYEKKTVQLPEEYFITPTEECKDVLINLLGKNNVVLSNRY
jgi:DNA polymerase-3 subunit alpha